MEKRCKNDLYRIVGIIGVIFICVLISDYSIKFSAENNINSDISEIMEAIDEYNVDSVFIYNDYMLARTLNIYDFDHKYIDLRENMQPVGWGTNFDGYEHEILGNEVLFIIDIDNKDGLKKYYGDIKLIRKVNNMAIYMISEQKIDFITAFPYSNSGVPRANGLQVTGKSDIRKVTDYPYSTGIDINNDLGYIDNEGNLVADGKGTLLESPAQRIHSGKYVFSIIANVKNNDVIYFRLFLKNSDTMLNEFQLQNGENIFNSEIGDYSDFAYSIFSKGGSASIKSITIEAVN